MVGMKDAVRIAGGFIADLFKDATDIRLEEVELGGPNWEITFSFVPSGSGNLAAIMGGNRSYKIVRVDSETGEPVSVLIRKL